MKHAPIREINAEDGKAVVPPPPEILEDDPELSPEEQEEARRAYLLQRFWISGRGFWGRGGGRWAWAFTVGLFVLIVANLIIQYRINVWNRSIFDALEKHDSDRVFFLTSIFIPLALGSVALGVLQVFARMSIQRRWRGWLNDAVLTRWLAHGRYYQLNLVGGDHKNPESRIAEDLRVATDAPVDFAAGVTSAFLSATTFIVVLWTIGGALTLSYGGSTVTIPGFLVIAAVAYAVVASGSMTWIGRNFVAVSESKNQAEADYRYALTRVRENGESIALLGGEEEERAGIDRSFGNVLRQWARLAGQHMRTTVVSQGSSLIAPVIPILLCAPKFLDGSMSLGEVMQAASAFTIVQAAFGWLVDNYPRLAEWNAGARRIASLMMSLDGLERAEQGDGIGRIKRGETDDEAMMRLRDLSVTLDDGTAVVGETDVRIDAGERVLFAGESGSGKSTLVRAIAGLWPWGGGNVDFHPDRRLFMLPQKPYVPSGTLRRAVAYPAAEDDWTVEEMAQVLEKVGLGHLKDKLEEDAPWDQTLSGGEKQRLAFARLFLHNPDIVVLDEATSALDDKSQDKLMQLLGDELRNATVVSVAHRPELEAFHSRKIVLERRKGGAKLVSDIDLVPHRGRRRLLGRWLRQRAAPRPT
ncbi:ABC transporter ATP-binding protein/permease [Bradyrhizobium sp. U87765 SZCCT0131]|uniref:ABC transporter ATP-binding protein/permease n=1 Tax=unclassified Bradyrhizobium TaxID=2631580 RepID=UPI001BAA13B4|nr:MULTISPECIES: ABC transporter ATP-binding protein/permease [unclassified Bradyrhizobium]MBR1218834.1 ABC transporter ATP-binding protein/permease [Bradyrhizobium sp. U87765 SZCCT0131]MBR1261485.1 ABC transporter ATP-binding protein/permease [Bradyrhizobium sp. U87765 SZCCT0134]MBR1306662.1 ABC transporter ATP-binding protein/permease [Bradyrhizobium sp. U87765 SZCCT0110]MBR1317267.1 ABC transporter ATP-binding protein/permease [Bradyrhizobium sp. U87765 SZCCT0109]MBR1350969.1 ABC transporte